MGGQQPVTLLPNRMHWQGLWNAFARHGNVLNAVIARRLSKGGKKFGFVRFGNSTDALRAIERLNGFSMYGFRLTVALAIFNGKGRNPLPRNGDSIKGGSYRRATQMDMNIGRRSSDNLQGVDSDVGKVSIQGGKEKRRIIGHVEEEDMWKLKRCLVGEMATVCYVKSISLRL
ncbi:hypothetical protein V6N13_033130 [Hibiscus sabdariffa]